MKWISVKDKLPELEHYVENHMPTWAAPYVFIWYSEWKEVDIAYYVAEDKVWYEAYRGDAIQITETISHWAHYSTPENKKGE